MFTGTREFGNGSCRFSYIRSHHGRGIKKGSPLKSQPLQEGFHAPREDRDNPSANSQDESSNPGADNEDTSNKTVEYDEGDDAIEGQKCKVCGDNVGSLFGSIVCVPCKTFFLRYGSDHESFKCKFGGNCTITPLSRTRCKHCRYQRCNAVGMWKKVRPAEIQVREGQQACVVCCDIANGVHFGAITCEGCKKFFRRGLLEHDSYSCKNDKRCPINPQTRNSCRYCRYQMCLQAGMSREAIQMGRPSKMKSEALRFLRINSSGNNNNNRSQQHKKPKKRNNSSDVTIEDAMDDDDDDDVKGGFTSAKKRKSCSSVGEPKENPVVQTTFQGSKRDVDADYVSPAHVPSRNGGVGCRNQSPLSRIDGYWNDLEPMETNNRVTNGFFLKRSPLAESRETPIENLKCQGQANGPRMVRPSGGKNEEGFDLRHVREHDSPWFNPRLNREGYENSTDFSASYKSNTKVTTYRELHTSAAVGCQDFRTDKYRSRAPLDRQTFAATNGPVGYVDSSRIGEYHPRHRLNERTHLQQRNSSGCLYQNHQQLRRNSNSLATQDILQNNNNNNNNGKFRTPLLTGPVFVANNAQFGIDSEAPPQVSNVQIPVPRDAAGISRESALHDSSLVSSRLSPVKGRKSSHPDEVNGFKRSDPRGLQRALVGKSMMKLMEEHDKVYNPKGQKQQCEGRSSVYGEPVASSSSSSSLSSSSSSSSSSLSTPSSLITSSLLTNIHASRLLSSATLNSSPAIRPSRMSFSPPSSASSATGSFSRQQSPVSFGGDRNSPYSSVMMLLSSCQLFNEASKNPFQLPSSSETSARGIACSTTCNSLDEESVMDSSRNARITRLLDSPEQSRITEAYWLRHDELPDESLMLNDKHLDVINQIVLAYEKFLQCGTNINITLKKELESWNLHSQVPLQGSISLPEWIQVKVIPVYTYTSITYCKSLPGFTDLPLSDQATLIRLGQTQSRIMLAAVHWFDSQKKNFEDFLSWRPLDLFKQRLISYAEKIQKLQLDFIESALLNALIIIAADFPGLENPILINQLRQRILLPFRAYTTAKFGTPNQRMERLFRHIPETRQLGFLHYKMTMKASLRAEEVEKSGE